MWVVVRRCAFGLTWLQTKIVGKRYSRKITLQAGPFELNLGSPFNCLLLKHTQTAVNRAEDVFGLNTYYTCIKKSVLRSSCKIYFTYLNLTASITHTARTSSGYGTIMQRMPNFTLSPTHSKISTNDLCLMQALKILFGAVWLS